ncbi:alpha/beta fold hydrolase [Nocardiopsis sp. CNR-923]|uniref:alpha/beta fold hydrolase n=1 Tax=Nocardiopsis sp. CNR-923 TaxID=1904965 RepID=UPI00117DD0BE|nr:hypothetical protein [Nocardiopsis sp. CNR-923]
MAPRRTVRRPERDGALDQAGRGRTRRPPARHTAEVEDAYADLDLPALVVWGREDTWLPLERGERLAAALLWARLHPLTGAGHLVQEDAPAELTAALLDFLA